MMYSRFQESLSHVRKGLLVPRIAPKHNRADFKLIKLKESFDLIEDITTEYGLSSIIYLYTNEQQLVYIRFLGH